MRRILLPVLSSVALTSGTCYGTSGDLDRIHVITQVCFPSKVLTAESWVQRTVIVKTGRSSGAMNSIGTTQSGQVVFESYAVEPDKLQAIILTVFPNGDNKVFYVAPGKFENVWSAWIKANGVTSDRLADTFVESRRLNELEAGSPDLPKIRYRVMYFSEYLKGISERRAKGEEKDIPSC